MKRIDVSNKEMESFVAAAQLTRVHGRERADLARDEAHPLRTILRCPVSVGSKFLIGAVAGKEFIDRHNRHLVVIGDGRQLLLESGPLLLACIHFQLGVLKGRLLLHVLAQHFDGQRLEFHRQCGVLAQPMKHLGLAVTPNTAVQWHAAFALGIGSCIEERALASLWLAEGGREGKEQKKKKRKKKATKNL
jgi:hypothetical protein